MIDIEHMDKKAVHDVMLDLLYSINVGWFKLESHLTEIYSSLNRNPELNKLLIQVYEDFSRYEAKRLLRTLDIKGTDIDSIIEVLKHSHWFAFENMQVEKLTAKCIRMRTIDCSTQRAMKKRGGTPYDCTLGGNLACREGFFAEINDSAEVKRIFAPPESVPSSLDNNVSCEWEISISR